MSKEERAHIEEVELFNRAGIKVCVFGSMSQCEGEVITIFKPPEKDAEGKVVKYGIQMNVCVAHRGAAEEDSGWQVKYDE